MRNILLTIIIMALKQGVCFGEQCQQVASTETPNSIDSSLPYLCVVPCIDDPAFPSFDSLFNHLFYAHYAIIQAEDDTSIIRFTIRNGCQDDQWYKAPKSDTPYVFLDGFGYEHERFYARGLVHYLFTTRIRLDGRPSFEKGIIAYVRIWAEASNTIYLGLNDRKLVREYAISESLFFAADSNIACFASRFEISDSLPGNFINYQIVSTGKDAFSIDWFKVSNSDGEHLVMGQYDAIFIERFRTQPEFFGWQEQYIKYDQLIPARHLGGLMNRGAFPYSIISAPQLRVYEINYPKTEEAGSR